MGEPEREVSPHSGRRRVWGYPPGNFEILDCRPSEHILPLNSLNVLKLLMYSHVSCYFSNQIYYDSVFRLQLCMQPYKDKITLHRNETKKIATNNNFNQFIDF